MSVDQRDLANPTSPAVAEALDSPFLLLPFRPTSDPSSSRGFIDSFFKSNASDSAQYRGTNLQQELRLTDPTVLCSILKWCWSRMPKGVVSWPVYETFRLGEKESDMARNAFDAFIPMGSDSPARTNIIIDYFALIATVAAHGKMNGLGGRKLSRLAGWWAFEHSDGGKGFDGGYKSWASAADASSHLFFAYLRSLSPDTDPSMNVIERIPRSLQALLAQTEYPPETPTLLQRSTPRVVMIVDQVSPTPFALLRRAKHFEYRQHDRVLREYSEFDDPVDALTDECKRVLYAISTINSSAAARSRHGIAKPGETWSSFTNLGFSDLGTDTASHSSPHGANGSASKSDLQGIRSAPRSRNADYDRPTTPSWGDFMSSGFLDDGSRRLPTHLLPPDKVLPPIGSRTQTPSIMSGAEGDDDVAPGELAAITEVELDDAFWWVWMTSLAGEETNGRKAVFGRCTLIETTISNGKWLIMEEQVKGASPDPIEGAQIVEKKSRFGFTRRGKSGRGKPSGKGVHSPSVPEETNHSANGAHNKSSIGPDQRAKIKAAAAALSRKQDHREADPVHRRGRQGDAQSTKTASVLTTGLQSEAGPAMKWANTYDKSTIRAAYLGSDLAGTGNAVSTDDLMRKTSSARPKADDRSRTQLSQTDEPLPEPAGANVETPSTQANEPVPASEDGIPSTAATRGRIPEESSLPPLPASDVDMPSAGEQHDAQKVPLPETTAEEKFDPMEKEIGGPLPSAPAGGHINRRSVPRGNIAEHPAFRQQPPQQEPEEQEEQRQLPQLSPQHPASTGRTTSPEQNPAVIAAQRALEGSGGSTSPESYKSGKLKKQPGQSGLKKFFGRNKDKADRRSMDVHQTGAMSGGLSPPADDSVSRKLSLMRKKRSVQPPAPQTPPPAPITKDPEPAPTSITPASNGDHNDSMVALSRVDTQERNDAEIAFSRFDQGPMVDMPGAMPRESIEDASTAYAPEVSRHGAAAPEHSRSALETPAQEFATPLERDDPANDVQSETTMDEHEESAAPPGISTGMSKDRWERIRENAARRAANARGSEEQSTQSRPTESGKTDEGETSGEESESPSQEAFRERSSADKATAIESRVARIKARVAELTGSMEAGAPASLRR